MKIINRDLTQEKDGVPGYLAHPDRKEPGPAVMIVHHHYGVTGNMKVNVCNFAKLGYTTLVPDLYKMLGESDGVHEAQKKTTDGQFTEILTTAWRFLTSKPEVAPSAAPWSATAWAGASASISSPPRRACAPS
jgi:dienelactone hydrolase